MTHMFDLDGWVQIDCTVADAFYTGLGQTPPSGRGAKWAPVRIGSTLTDLEGERGTPLVFTELVWEKNGYVVLREYRWPGDPTKPCEHWVPGPGFDQKAFVGEVDDDD